MAYFWSSGTKVIRGSSMPHNSSGYFSGSAGKEGALSICQSSTPFAERAAQR